MKSRRIKQSHCWLFAAHVLDRFVSPNSAAFGGYHVEPLANEVADTFGLQTRHARNPIAQSVITALPKRDRLSLGLAVLAAMQEKEPQLARGTLTSYKGLCSHAKSSMPTLKYKTWMDTLGCRTEVLSPTGNHVAKPPEDACMRCFL